MIEVNRKKINFIDADWKICIILDACRFDVFSNLSHMLPGNLKVAKTFCSGTQEWMYNNIYGNDCSNIIYVNPIIMFNNFIPKHNFFNVVMAWKTHWDYTHGTILPEDITKVALEEIKKNPDKRFIIHYHQPHPPYLQDKFKGIDGPVDKPEEIIKQVGKKRAFDFLEFIQGRMRKTLGCEKTWSILLNMGMEPIDYYGKIYKLYGMEGLKSGYKETLKMTMKSIKDIIESNAGKIVVTSDHSKNIDGSTKNLRKQSVPWLEIQ